MSGVPTVACATSPVVCAAVVRITIPVMGMAMKGREGIVAMPSLPSPIALERSPVVAMVFVKDTLPTAAAVVMAGQVQIAVR